MHIQGVHYLLPENQHFDIIKQCLSRAMYTPSETKAQVLLPTSVEVRLSGFVAFILVVQLLILQQGVTPMGLRYKAGRMKAPAPRFHLISDNLGGPTCI
jgi:hypothetical protein